MLPLLGCGMALWSGHFRWSNPGTSRQTGQPGLGGDIIQRQGRQGQDRNTGALARVRKDLRKLVKERLPKATKEQRVKAVKALMHKVKIQITRSMKNIVFGKIMSN